MTKVEEVAKAIEGRWHAGAINSEELARAAISAMRSPTEEMIYHKDNGALRRSIIGIYQAMIDGALSSSVPATADPSGLDMQERG